MAVTLKPILAITLAASFVIASPISAQESEDNHNDDPATDQELGLEHIDPTQVLAKVNETEITLAHVIAVRATLPQQYDQLPAALLLDGILEQLIQQTLLSQSFDGELSLQAQTMIENERRAVVAGETIAQLMETGFDEAVLMSAYDEQYPEEPDQLEYRAAHILVDTEEEAQALVEELAGGAQFSALARERSTGPSASVGGDLGWFGDGDMVPEFFDAVVELKPGEVSPPVQTQFGWHVINLTETRETQRPDFDTVRPELEEQMRQTRLEEYVAALEAAAVIDRADRSDLNPDTIMRFDLLEN